MVARSSHSAEGLPFPMGCVDGELEAGVGFGGNIVG